MHFLIHVLRQAAKDFVNDHCSTLAAAISFYAFFSLFPMLIFFLSILGLFLQDTHLQYRVLELVVVSIPAIGLEEENVLLKAIRRLADVSSGALSLVALLGMAWSGSGMFGAIRRSINLAYDLGSHRPFVRQKLVDLAMLMGIGFFFVLSIAVTTLLRAVRRFSLKWSWVHQIVFLSSFIGEKGLLWTASSYILPMALSFGAFIILFWLVPAVRLPFRNIWPAALVSAILFELCKVGFVFYLENFSRYSLVFGSLGAVVAFLFWVYLSAVSLLLGAEIASQLQKSGSESPSRAPAGNSHKE